MKEVTWDLDKVFISFNRENFKNEILIPDFGNNIKLCAKAIGLPVNYLRDLITQPTRDAGTQTLTYIYRYCIRTGHPPERYMFVIKDNPTEKSEEEQKWT